MKEDILDTLIGQHKHLKQLLEHIDCMPMNNGVVCSNVVNKLEELRKSLQGHMQLEDEVFYPQMIDRMRKNNFDTEKTEQFIAEMKLIYGVALDFFRKYSESSAILGDVSGFKADLAVMKSAILDRISAEEEGVYMYWKM